MQFLLGLAFPIFVVYCLWFMFSTVLGAVGAICVIASTVMFILRKRGNINIPTTFLISLLAVGAVCLPLGISHRMSLDDAREKQAAIEAQKAKEKAQANETMVRDRCGEYPYVPKEMLNVAHTVQNYNNSVGAYTNSADHLEAAIQERQQKYSQCEDRVRRGNS
ncbi:hypothetical protein [Caballeronia grimmiae]|uniref:hypothetical protein n=1 Tax=Caballeronia grimmiae TaxID=1071679 RepID=UPI0038BACEB9